MQQNVHDRDFEPSADRKQIARNCNKAEGKGAFNSRLFTCIFRLSVCILLILVLSRNFHVIHCYNLKYNQLQACCVLVN